MKDKRRNTSKITTFAVLSALLVYVGLLIGYPTLSEIVKNAYATYLVQRYQRAMAAADPPATIAIVVLPTFTSTAVGVVAATPTSPLATLTPFASLATSTPQDASTPQATITPSPTAMLYTPVPGVFSEGEALVPGNPGEFYEWTEATPDAATPTPVIYPTSAYPRRLVIPAIHLDAPIVGVGPKYQQIEGKTVLSWVSPDMYAVGWHLNSVPIGYTGNTVLNGHNNIYGSVFALLHTVELGAEIIVYTDEGEYHYQVAVSRLLQEAGAALDQRVENAAWAGRTVDERVTLITCWPPVGNSHRLILVAFPFESTPTPTP